MLDQIICGDCLEVMPTIPDASVDCIVADPPYFSPIETYKTRTQFKKHFSDYGVLGSFFKTVATEFKRILKPNGHFYVFCDSRTYAVFYPPLFDLMKTVRGIVWDKQIAGLAYTWRHQHELVLWGEAHESTKVPIGDGDIIQCRVVPVEKRVHHAEKPVRLIELFLLKSTNESDLVLDPFNGAGSTCIAAKGLGRHYIGIDVDEEYCAIAERRLAEML